MLNNFEEKSALENSRVEKGLWQEQRQNLFRRSS